MVKLEYVWLDGNKPAQLRSKSKFVEFGVQTIQDVPRWNFDGSSTNQAPGDDSECLLLPSRLYTLNREYHIVLCEVHSTDGKAHESNRRALLRDVIEKSEYHDLWLGFEQEYFITKDSVPLGFTSTPLKLMNDFGMLIGPGPQGPFYCSVGGSKALGRQLVERHVALCEKFNITLTGVNAEVAPGQWEYQCFAKDPLKAADDLWMSRYILLRTSEEFDYDIDFSPKPAGEEYNGSGCHTNFSSSKMRDTGYFAGRMYFTQLMQVLEERKDIHIAEYGEDNDQRLTGKHETQSIDTFSWGVADRGASIRIPNEVVANEWKGYAEDRRPAANCDPYNVIRLLIEALNGVEQNEKEQA